MTNARAAAVLFGSIFGLLVLGLAWFKYVDYSEARERAAARAAYQESQRQRMIALRSRFEERGASIKAEAQQAIDDDQYQHAIQLLEPWLPLKDSAVESLHLAATDLLARREAEKQARAQRIADEEARKKAAAEEQATAAARNLEQRLGPKPYQSPWDGSVDPVEDYFENLANDPDSVEFGECSEVTPGSTGWMVRCVYRAKNAFGAMVRDERLYIIRDGRVVSAEPWRK